MRTFTEQNPMAVTVYFAAVTGIPMFCMDPVILVLSLLGAVLLFFLQNGRKGGGTHLYTLALFFGMALLNPLLNHNGVTVLFVMNHNPVTLEALVYGFAAATMIVSVLYWFRSYARIMTSDKLLYLFGAVSPKVALLLSMTLRYVPLFGSQVRRVGQTQKALGLYKEDNLVDRFRGGLRIFSVMVTWALENGIVTADSMTARGYGIGRRSRFTIFRFTWGDGVLTAVSVLLAAFTVVGIADVSYAYYPALRLPALTAAGGWGYLAYGVLILLPACIEGKEAAKWRYLRSRI